MGHSWDSWGQKMVTNLHKQQQRIRRNALNLLIKFVNVCCQLNILRVLKTGRRGSVSWVRIPPPPPLSEDSPPHKMAPWDTGGTLEGKKRGEWVMIESVITSSPNCESQCAREYFSVRIGSIVSSSLNE